MKHKARIVWTTLFDHKGKIADKGSDYQIDPSTHIRNASINKPGPNYQTHIKLSVNLFLILTIDIKALKAF